MSIAPLRAPPPDMSDLFLYSTSPSPKRVAFWPLATIIMNTGNVVSSWRDGLTESEREDKRRTDERMQILAARMQHVSNHSPYTHTYYTRL